MSATFSELGAIVVDGDVIAREVVEPGTEGLAKLVEAFGDGILTGDGSLDRPALAAIAFSDEEHRATLNGIVHPLVGQRRAELIAAAADDAVIVEDIPLLVESQMAPMFPLVIIVHADAGTPGEAADRVPRLQRAGRSGAHRGAGQRGATPHRRRRLVGQLGLGGRTRRAGPRSVAPPNPAVRAEPAGRPAGAPGHRLVPFDPQWHAQAQRILARLRTACGHRADRIDHIGATAVAGMAAKDVIDVQITVAALEIADEIAESLSGAGYVPMPVDRGCAQARRPQHHAAVRPCRRRHVVAEAAVLLGRPGAPDERARPCRGVAQSAVRAAVRRLAAGRPTGSGGVRRAGGAPSAGPRSRGCSRPIAEHGSGPTPPGGGRRGAKRRAVRARRAAARPVSRRPGCRVGRRTAACRTADRP